MNVSKNTFLSIEQMQDQYLKSPSKKNVEKEGSSFEQILSLKNETRIKQSEELVFSKHAKNRLSERNIDLSDKQLERLKDGADKAEKKGIKESLVLVDNLAFIVNVKNNTVITAMDQTESNENIFTNIDGAVIS